MTYILEVETDMKDFKPQPGSSKDTSADDKECSADTINFLNCCSVFVLLLLYIFIIWDVCGRVREVRSWNI